MSTQAPTTPRTYARPHSTHRRAARLRRQLLRGLGAALAAPAILAAVAAAAFANQMTVYSCHDPAGNPVGHDGWELERTADAGMTATDTCSTEHRGALSARLSATATGYPNLARVQWIFKAPTWGSIANYQMLLNDSYGSPYSGSGMGQAYVIASDETDPNYDFRNLGNSNAGAVLISRTPPAPVNIVWLNSSCDGMTGACPANQEISWIDMGYAKFLLNDSTHPTVSGVSGPLVSGTPQRGVSETSFAAADSGPGVYSAHLTVDGQIQPSMILDTNNGWCQNLGQTTDGTRAFAHPTPCSASASASLAFDTTQLADGSHTVKLLVDDASGNTTIGWTGTVTSMNAPLNSALPTILTPSQPAVGAAVSAQPGAWSAPTGAGSITYAYQWESCDSSAANCQPIAGAQGAGYTPAPSDVGHTLRVQVTAADNDGASSATSSATSAVPASSSSLGAAPSPGSGPTATSSSGSTGSILAGVPGAGAALSQGAVLNLGVASTITRSYRKRAFTLTGRLTDLQGQPIPAGTLDVLQRIVASNTVRALKHATTRADGTFTIAIPAGPSRLLTVGYRPTGAAGYATSTSVIENVSAGVTLKITPRRTSSNGTIHLEGQVSGAVPHRGAIVDLLVHYHGRWAPFRTPRTNRHGRFKVAYQFQGGLGRFPFRAEIPAGQASFPYAPGYSNTVNVTTR